MLTNQTGDGDRDRSKGERFCREADRNELWKEREREEFGDEDDTVIGEEEDEREERMGEFEGITAKL